MSLEICGMSVILRYKHHKIYFDWVLIYPVFLLDKYDKTVTIIFFICTLKKVNNNVHSLVLILDKLL